MVARPTPDQRQLGLAIREVREARGITGERLAQEAEVDLAHLNRAENHGRNLTLATFMRLAGVLEISASGLMQKAEEIAQREMSEAEARDG